MDVALRQVLGLGEQPALLVERPRLRAHRVVRLVAGLGQPEVSRAGRQPVARNQARGQARQAVEVGHADDVPIRGRDPRRALERIGVMAEPVAGHAPEVPATSVVDPAQPSVHAGQAPQERNRRDGRRGPATREAAGCRHADEHLGAAVHRLDRRIGGLHERAILVGGHRNAATPLRLHEGRDVGLVPQLEHVHAGNRHGAVEWMERAVVASPHRPREATELPRARAVHRSQAIPAAESRRGPPRRAEPDVEVDLDAGSRGQDDRPVDARDKRDELAKPMGRNAHVS